jgi:hypothetical protein
MTLATPTLDRRSAWRFGQPGTHFQVKLATEFPGQVKRVVAPGAIRAASAPSRSAGGFRSDQRSPRARVSCRAA